MVILRILHFSHVKSRNFLGVVLFLRKHTTNELAAARKEILVVAKTGKPGKSGISLRHLMKWSDSKVVHTESIFL